MKRHRTKSIRQDDLPLQVAFDQRVLEYIAAELTKSPDVEEGGKYVGYLLPERATRLRSLGLDPNRPALIVTDFLPSGPKAIRTAVELLPDGEYQEGLFRQIERMDPEVEHVGTWHSHHCNGLQTLSGGDIEGYHRTVNKAAYRPDYFLASLVTRLPRGVGDVGWINHFLFARGKGEHYQITDSIVVVDWSSAFRSLIDHGAHDGTLEHRPRNGNPAVPTQERNGIAWYETDEGRTVLGEDKQLFNARFRNGVVATRRGQRIVMTGRVSQTTISTMYPVHADERTIIVSVSHEGATILQIHADLRWRQLAVMAAITAAETLQT